MAEIYFVVKKQTISYDGIFNMDELYHTIDKWFKDKGYDKNEVKNEEIVGEEGKQIFLLLEPWKKVTDYSKNVIRVDIKIANCKEVLVDIDGHEMKMNKGKVIVATEAFLMTDYEDRFDRHPIYYFTRTIFDKFFFRIYTSKYQDELKEHTKELRMHIKAFLNLYRFKLEK